jgi:hypothetical protein
MRNTRSLANHSKILELTKGNTYFENEKNKINIDA